MSDGHVFISYARDDADEVDELDSALAAAGIPVWRDTSELWPGDNWRLKIKQAIAEDALVVIACFSERSLARTVSYQNEEVALAIEQLRLRRPDVPWLIPVRFDDCKLADAGAELHDSFSHPRTQTALTLGMSAPMLENTHRLVALVMNAASVRDATWRAQSAKET